MNIKDFTTGIQHIGIPTNNIEETSTSISPWVSQQPCAPSTAQRK